MDVVSAGAHAVGSWRQMSRNVGKCVELCVWTDGLACVVILVWVVLALWSERYCSERIAMSGRRRWILYGGGPGLKPLSLCWW